MCFQSSASCEYGITIGPMNASNVMARITAAEMNAARSRARRPSTPNSVPMWVAAQSIRAHPRIQPAIEQICDEVAQERDHAVHDDHPHHEGVVAVDRTLHEIAADPRQAEYRLHDQRPGEHESRRRP